MSHENIFACHRCKKQFNRYDNFSYHMRTCDILAGDASPTEQIQVGAGAKSPVNTDGIYHLHNKALSKGVESYRMELADTELAPETVLPTIEGA